MPGKQKIKHVLICVTGLTPQVVTETVYALGNTTCDDARLLPDQIHVLTTLRGKDRAVATLPGEEGQLSRLCHDYGWDKRHIQFGVDHIHVIRDAHGSELDDIRDEQDNAAAADFITGFIRHMAGDPAVRLHVSLAGGRKTMGFFTGYALSLYGRPEDRLSHVLVSPPFEFHPEFFYPPPQPRLLKTLDGDEVSTADARIRLADIPFVRLRSGLDSELVRGDLSFSEAVSRTQQLIDPPELRIDLATRAVFLQGYPLKLSDTPFIWLVWFADRARRGLPPIAFDDDGAQSLLATVRWLDGSDEGRPGLAVKGAIQDLQHGDKPYFDRNLSRLNKALRTCEGLTPSAAERYVVRSGGPRPRTTYALALAAETIHIEGEP